MSWFCFLTLIPVKIKLKNPALLEGTYLIHLSACPGISFNPSPSVPINGCINLASCTNLLYTTNVFIGH